MALHPENLVPMNQRTKEEQRRIASEGGKASGEARRAKKTMREYADFILSLPVSDKRKWNKLARMGIPPEGIDNKMAAVVALMQQAQAGDVQAFKELRSVTGENNNQDSDALERLDEVLKSLNEVMKNDD